MEYVRKLIALAEQMITTDEARVVTGLLNNLLRQHGAIRPGVDMLQLIKSNAHTAAFKSLVLFANRSGRDLTVTTGGPARAKTVRALLHLREKLALRLAAIAPTELASHATASQNDTSNPLEDAIAKVYTITVGRAPVAEEINIWKTNFDNGVLFHQFLLQMGSGPEAKQTAARQAIMQELGDGEYVQRLFELVLGRGAAAWEIEHWLIKLEEKSITRVAVLASLVETANKVFADQATTAPHDGLSCLIMGTGKFLTAAEWQEQAQQLPQPRQPDTRYANRFHIKGKPRVLVSGLASLYRGGEFIEQFMDNITHQDGFDEYCELVIIDADSPENEFETIKRYTGRHKNINYIRCNYRVGIYDAWNMAAKAARGEYLTNTNMDDLRRHDSFALQAATLDNLPFVDVVYQDLYYTFDPRLPFADIAAFGHQTTLPVVTPHNMIQFNSPHNAPMWRKRLHEELGFFDTHYKSAGDYEFWMRCLAAGKKFFKINDPHVVYYQNPKGLSTRPDTRGVVEAMNVHRTYCRKLIPSEALVPSESLITDLGLRRSDAVPATIGGRYALAQLALRNTARYRKFGSPSEART
jgi:hypothetical protein